MYVQPLKSKFHISSETVCPGLGSRIFHLLVLGHSKQTESLQPRARFLQVFDNAAEYLENINLPDESPNSGIRMS